MEKSRLKPTKVFLVSVLVFFILISLPIIPTVQSQTQVTKTPIKHVVIILLENHAFDSLFGVYPFGFPEIIDNVTLSVMRPVNYIYNLSLLKTLNQTRGNVTWVNVPVRPDDSRISTPITPTRQYSLTLTKATRTTTRTGTGGRWTAS